jgi:hypothetical protein
VNHPTGASASSAARGPLVVSPVNPRYFAVAGDDREVVYLTGSHVNNNLHDGLGFGRECPDHPEGFEFDAYLDFLRERGHNWATHRIRSG